MVAGNSGSNTIPGVVRALDGEAALVEVSRGCGRCHEEGGCGGQHLTQMFCSGQKLYRVDNKAAGAKVGDAVDIAISAGTVRWSANLVYGFPLIGVIGGAFIGMQFAGDTGAMAGGGLGLLLSWILLRRIISSTTRNSELRPYILFRSH